MIIHPKKEDEIFLAALERESPEERLAYVNETCAADVELRDRVLELLNSHNESTGAFDNPPPGLQVTNTSLENCSVGSQIGPYKLLEQIGEGGMGVVYMADQQAPVRRKVALKIIKPGMDTKQVIARFTAEQQALAMMDHPHIAKVFDAGATDGGRPYFVMELVKGVPITEYCDTHQLPIRSRLELMVKVCQAVQHAHQKGVIHRDLKPSNVLVAEYDDHAVPKVIDFGVAKATEQRLTERTMFTEFGQVIGTVQYMSPEQAKFNQHDVDTRCDVYSLGVLLYELLTGSTPFGHERLNEAAFDEMLRIIREEDPPTPSMRLSASVALPSIAANRSIEPLKLNRLVHGELGWIAMKAMEKDRNARYQSAMGFAADLEHWMRDEPLSIRARDPAYLLRIWLKQNIGSTGWAIVLGMIWGIGAGAFCWFGMLNPLELADGFRKAIYFVGLLIMGSGGLITVWLVRPKSAAADLASGIVTGTLAAVICYTLSWGWVAVAIAGVPYGIWLGMTSVLLFMGSFCVIETLAAGMLVRRHGQVRSAIGPYIELMAPSLLALVFACITLFRFATVGPSVRYWPLMMVPLLVLASTSVLARWPWYVRTLFHAMWAASLCAFLIMADNKIVG